jgi:hypothetical protein
MIKDQKWNIPESRNKKIGEDKHENRNGTKETDCDIINKRIVLTKDISENHFYSEKPDDFEIIGYYE